MAELLTVAETADRLGITVKAVEKRIERGTIQSLRKDGRRVVPVSEVARVEELSLSAKGPTSQGFPREGTGFPGGDLSGVLARLEALAAENGRFKALHEVSEQRAQEAEQRAEIERRRVEEQLFEANAKIQQLEAQLAERSVAVLDEPSTGAKRWWRRT